MKPFSFKSRILSKAILFPVTVLGLGSIKATVGDKISIYRKFFGLSQRKFALLIGIDPGTLGHWEQGKTMPRPDKFENLKKVLKKCCNCGFHGL